MIPSCCCPADRRLPLNQLEKNARMQYGGGGVASELFHIETNLSCHPTEQQKAANIY